MKKPRTISLLSLKVNDLNIGLGIIMKELPYIEMLIKMATVTDISKFFEMAVLNL